MEFIWMRLALAGLATLILLAGCAEDSRDFNAPAENELYKLLVTKPMPKPKPSI